MPSPLQLFWTLPSHLMTPDAPPKIILPKPRPEVAPEKVLAPFATRHRGMLRGLRLMFGLAVMLLLLFGFLNYDLYTVPGEKGGAKVFGIGRGDNLLLARYRFWREPRLGDVVFYRAPGEKGEGGNQVGRIVGVPGESIKRMGPTMSVGGREPLAIGFEIGPQAKIKDGDTVPEGKYLILVDEDTYEYGDSRQYGYIPQENIEYRLAMNLAGTWDK